MRPNRRGNAEEFRPVRQSVLGFSRRDTAAARAIRAQLQAAGVPAGEPRSLPKRERRGEVPYRALRPEVTSVGMSGGVSNTGQNGPDPMGAVCRVLGQVERATCCLGDDCPSSGLYGPVRSSQVRLGRDSVQCGLVRFSRAWWNDRENDHLSKRRPRSGASGLRPGPAVIPITERGRAAPIPSCTARRIRGWRQRLAGN